MSYPEAVISGSIILVQLEDDREIHVSVAAGTKDRDWRTRIAVPRVEDTDNRHAWLKEALIAVVEAL